MGKKIIVKVRKKGVLGGAFLGNKAYKEVTYDTDKLKSKHLKPPTKGHNKPFDYKLWNTLRRMKRV